MTVVTMAPGIGRPVVPSTTWPTMSPVGGALCAASPTAASSSATALGSDLETGRFATIRCQSFLTAFLAPATAAPARANDPVDSTRIDLEKPGDRHDRVEGRGLDRERVAAFARSRPRQERLERRSRRPLAGRHLGACRHELVDEAGDVVVVADDCSPRRSIGIGVRRADERAIAC